jgi:membrane protease subunit (stomatin/prohibitin family)
MEQEERKEENTSNDEIINITNITDNDIKLDKEKFSKGLMTLLSPVIEEMDSRIVAVKASQKELSKEIERLLAGMLNQKKKKGEIIIKETY